MESADVTFRVMFVDPWVDGFGAPMLKLDLYTDAVEISKQSSFSGLLPVPYPL